jgi:proteasome lid subunit RPN8/RPN11
VTGATPPPSPGGGRPSEVQGHHLQRVLPLAQSILWHPTSPGSGPRRPPAGPYAVFFDQKAVGAIHAHYETAGRQGMMGFLVGDLFECPTSRQRYVVVDATIRLNQAVYGDKTLVIVSRLWERIQDELHKIEGHLIGWYHSHPPINVELAPGDVETHLQYFKRPWHVALVLGAEHEGPVAGLFRPAPGDTSPNLSLPFYELIESDEGFVGGRKQSILPWINFMSEDKAVQHSDAPLPFGSPVSGAGTVEVVRPAPTPVPPPLPPPRPPRPPLPLLPGTQARPALGATAPPAVDREASFRASPPEPPTPPPPPPPPAPPASPVSPPGSPIGRRQTQMKPPPNALSSLPLLAAGGYDLGEVESRDSDAGVITPRVQDHPVLPRRTVGSTLGRPAGSPLGRATMGAAVGRSTQTPKAFAPALAPRRHGGSGGMIGLVVLLLVIGGAAGWYFFLRKPALESAPTQQAVTAAPAESVAATDRESFRAAVRDSLTAPAPTPVDTTWLAFDRIADSVTRTVGVYGDRRRQFDGGRIDCTGLSRGLVSVEDVWMDYNVGKKNTPPLDAPRAARDQTLYATVDSVDRHFDRSGCPRP